MLLLCKFVYFYLLFSFYQPAVSRGGSSTAAISMMERYIVIVNVFQQLTIITKRSILDVAAVLDPPLVSFYLPFRPLNKYLNWCQCQYYEAIYAFWGKQCLLSLPYIYKSLYATYVRITPFTEICEDTFDQPTIHLFQIFQKHANYMITKSHRSHCIVKLMMRNWAVM